MSFGRYEGLRGFGSVIESGTVRHWYIDKEGTKRWLDNDQMVEESSRTTEDEP